MQTLATFIATLNQSTWTWKKSDTILITVDETVEDWVGEE